MQAINAAASGRRFPAGVSLVYMVSLLEMWECRGAKQHWHSMKPMTTPGATSLHLLEIAASESRCGAPQPIVTTVHRQTGP